MTRAQQMVSGVVPTAPNFTALGIETATSRSTVAVCHAGKSFSISLSGSRPGAGEVYGAVDELFAAAGVVPKDLNCIAFGCGPGGFTGVRIAAAVTQGLAYGLQAPVFRCSTLALLAAGVGERASDGTVIAAALDARQGEAYIGFYQLINGVPVPRVPDALYDPSTFSFAAAGEAGSSFYLAGPGWSAYPELLTSAEALVKGQDFSCLPEAADLLPLAAQAWQANTLTDAFSAQPNYLRDKVTD